MSINLSVPAGATIPELKPKLTVIGVGGAGGNAVNNMIHRELEGVEFVVANTDAQALEQSQAEARIQLGANLTQGLGAGSQPDVGRAAAEEAIEEVLASLSGSHMAFIAAGMGGGTGTGAAPAIARAAKEAGILTVAVVTKPFQFEGAHRMRLAEAGVEELEQYVDTLIIIPNQNLFRVATENTTFADAFAMADEVLYSGVRGVTDLMVMPGLINLDFADIRSVMSEMGKAMMGTGEAEGERRALDAAEAAIANPLLDDTSMKGAKGVLINITGGSDITLFEVDEAASRIRAEVDQDAYIIIGSAFDNDLQGKMRVSVVATGIDAVAGVMPQPTMLRVTDAVAPQRSLPVASPAAADKPKETLSIVAEEIEIAEEPSNLEPEMQEPDSPLARLVREAQTNKGSQSEAPEMADVEPEVSAGPEVASEPEQVVAEPPAEEEVSPSVEVTTDKPELGNAPTIEPPAAMPRAEADDAFIPPQPVAPANEEPAGEADSVATDALMGDQATVAELTLEPEKACDEARPSLFELVTRTGRAAFGRVVADGAPERRVGAADVINQADSGRSAMQQSRPNDSPTLRPVAEAVTASVAMAAEAVELVPTPETVAVSEEAADADDLLDIPAFLRRQAN